MCMHGAVARSVAQQRKHVRTCTTHHTQGTSSLKEPRPVQGAHVGRPCVVRRSSASPACACPPGGFLVAAPGRAVSGVSGTIIVPSRCHGGSACSVWAAETYGRTWSVSPRTSPSYSGCGLPAVLWCRPLRVVPWLRGPPSFYMDVPDYAGCVSPSTFRMIVAISTMINMIWVANLAIFSGRFVAAWLMRSASSISMHSLLEEEPVTHFVVLPIQRYWRLACSSLRR